MIPANEMPRPPHVEPFDWNDELDRRKASWEFDTPVAPEAFAFDPLAVAATEYVAAEMRGESLWWSPVIVIAGYVCAVCVVGIVFALIG